jgi:hypothetical protein
MSHFMSAPRLVPLLTIAALAACARNTKRPASEVSLAQGSSVMSACKPSERLVVENKTGYPVRVGAGDGGVNAIPGSSVSLWTVQNGVVDTVGSVPGDRKQIFFNVDQPTLPSGAHMLVSVSAPGVRQARSARQHIVGGADKNSEGQLP